MVLVVIKFKCEGLAINVSLQHKKGYALVDIGFGVTSDGDYRGYVLHLIDDI